MSANTHSIRRPLIGFTAFAVVAILLTYVIYSTLERSVPGETNNYAATFNDASGLKAGDDVRMAGVRVGRVSDVALDGGKARVSFSVQQNQPMYVNTKAAIRYQNLVGLRYLALTLDGDTTGAPLPAGATLRLRGEDSFDVTKLLAGFQPVFDTLTPEQVNGLSEGLVQAFQGDAISLSRTLAEVGQVASDMANRDHVLGAIITNLSIVMSELASQGNHVTTLLDGAATMIEKLNSNSAAFGDSITKIGRTADGFADVLARNRASLQSAGQSGAEATTKLIRAGARLDRMAVELPKFLGHFPFVMSQGAYLNLYVCELDVSIGNVLLPPGVLTSIGSKKHSSVCR